MGIDEFESSSVGTSLSKLKHSCPGACDHLRDRRKVGHGDTRRVSVDPRNTATTTDRRDAIGGRRVMCHASSCRQYVQRSALVSLAYRLRQPCDISSRAVVTGEDRDRKLRLEGISRRNDVGQDTTGVHRDKLPWVPDEN